MKKRFLCCLLALMMLLGMIPMNIGAQEVTSETQDDAYHFTSFYVTDGLVMLLDAMDSSSSNQTIDTAAGKWYSSVVNTDRYATLVNGNLTGAYAWSARTIRGAYKGIGYYQTASQAASARGWWTANANTPGLDMGNDNLPQEDYTLEMVLNPYGITNDTFTERAVYTADYLGLFHGFSLGPLKCWSFPSVRSGTNETYDKRWYYTNGNGSSTSVGIGNDIIFNSAYADGQSNLSSLGKVISYGITHSIDKMGSTNTADWVPTYEIYNGATAEISKTLSAGQYIPVSGATSSYGKFWLMYNWPCTVYSVRVYDRVISDAERAQNHMADILGFYSIDVHLFATVSDADKATAIGALSAAFASYTFADTTDYTAYSNTKAAAQKLFESTITPYAGKEDNYSELYVQEGLTVLLNAFGEVNATVRFDEEGTYTQKIDKKTYTYAKWYNKVDGSYVKLIGGSAVWSFTGKGGITYKQSAGNYNSGIDLGIENLPTASYTVETFLTPIGLTDASGNRVLQSGQYGPNYENGSAFGPLKTLVFPTVNNKSAGYSAGFSDNGTRWYYSDGTYNYSASLNKVHATGFIYKGSNASYAGQYLFQVNTEYTMKATNPISWVVTHTRSGNETDGYSSKYVSYSDAVQKMSITYPYSTTDYTLSYVPVNDTMEFALMRAFPCTVYSIRVYDRVLSTAELRSNRFVDIAAYYGLDLSLLRALPEETKANALSALGSIFATVAPEAYTTAAAFNAKKAELQLIVDEQLQSFSYIPLYVQDALTGLFLAYKSANTTDLTNKVWRNLVDSSKNATIGGTWEEGANGGIYFTTSASNASYYIDFGISLLPSGSFTVESVAKVSGYTQNADGVTPLPINGTYGNTSTSDGTFTFGPFKGFLYGGKAQQLHLNQIRWVYAEAGLDWNAIGNKYGWGATDSTAFYNNMTVHNFSVVHTFTAATDSTAASSSYALYNGANKYMTVSVPSGHDQKNPEVIPIASNMKFHMFRSAGSHVFAVRVYSDILTVAERAQNNVVDILAYYGIDATDLSSAEADVRAQALALLGESLASYTFAEGDAYAKAYDEVLLKYVRVMQACGIDTDLADRVTPYYTNLYVSKGLVTLLDAFDKNEETTTINMADGRWYSSLGNTAFFATLTGDTSYWKRGTDGKGLESTQTYDQRNANVGINFGIEALPAGSYTIEYIAAFKGFTDENGNRYVDATSTYGYNFENAFAMGPLKQLSFPCSRLPGNDGNMEQRWFYVQSGGWAAVSYRSRFSDRHLQNVPTDKIFSETIVHSLSESKEATYSFLSNGKQNASFTITSAEYVAHNATSENLFRMFYNFPATVYSIRIYDRVLNEAERKQNHFADLIAYFGFDVSDFWGELSAAEKTALYDATWSYDFTVSSDTVWNLISRYALTEELYVTDGLAFLLTAYSSNSSDIDLANGRWYNKYSDDYATLIGKNTHWNLNENGVGYSLVFDTQDSEVGISLPVSLLDSNAFTVEIAADILGLREDNGGKTGNNDTFNHSVDYTMAFGSLKAKQWNSPLSPSDLSYPTKWYYAAGANAKLESASASFELDTPIFSPEYEGGRTLAITKSTADNTETYTFFGNFASLGSVSATKAAADGDNFLLFYQMPANVYAIRVYNRALTAEEQLQNHFADIVYYYGLDISEFSDAENKSAVYEGMKDFGFDMTRNDAQAILNFLLGDNTKILEAVMEYDGLSARLSGANSGIRSIYRINPVLIKALETKYNVAYGAITGIGDLTKNSELLHVNGTRDLAVSGTFANGYTATSPNSACVVVYGTNGASYASGVFLADGESFALTSILDNASENATYYDIGMVYAGFLSLTDKETAETLAPCYYYAEGTLFGTNSSTYGASASIKEVAYHFVEKYEGTNADMYRYNSNERLRNILYACGYTDADLRDIPDEASMLANLQADLTARMTQNTADYPVLVAGTLNGSTATDINGNSYTLKAGEKAIWLQYAPELNPTSGALTHTYAVYFWYPMATDPLSYTTTEGGAEVLDVNTLKAMGAIRVFAYMSVPNGATQGIVCVHGGGGHAYASYTATAANHGYAAIAFDTEGYHADGTGGSANVVDALGHKAKDSFKTAREAITEQWMYYAISDCAFANTILRSINGVSEDKVGITGISWGGLTTSIATCYDQRFAFAVPVYLSYYLGYGENLAQFTSVAEPFAAALWQDESVLEANMVPTLILNSQKDLWADINSSVRTYETMKKNNEHVYLVIKPDLSHSQQAGAPPAEIYRFGDWVCSGYGDEKACYETDRTVTNKLGKEYKVQLTVAKDLTNPTATMYYTTSAITYAGGNVEQAFYTKNVELTYVGKDADGNSIYEMTVSVPNEAYLYFISYKAASSYDAGVYSPYDSSQTAFKGYVYGSSSIIVVNGGAINGK